MNDQSPPSSPLMEATNLVKEFTVSGSGAGARKRIVRAVDVRALQKQVDALCAEQRRLDNEIQQANWMTEIDL